MNRTATRFCDRDRLPSPSVSAISRKTPRPGSHPRLKPSWPDTPICPPPHGLPSPPNTLTNSSDGSVAEPRPHPRNRPGLLARPPQSQPHRPALSPPSGLFNARSLRSPALGQLTSGRPPSHPHTPSPPSRPRAFVQTSYSSGRRSMDHPIHEAKKPASLSRNSTTCPVKRVSAAWKPQGKAPRSNAPRHSLQVTPTKTVVPPALVTDVPLLKRTSTTDLSKFHNPPSDPTIESLHKTGARSNRTGSVGSVDLKSTKVRLRNRSKEFDLAKIQEPPIASRSKKLMSMKEKNERILASINATLSPPTSPAKLVLAPSAEPPLPPPPPSSDSSSASSSTSSDTDADSLTFKAVLSPPAPLHPSCRQTELAEPETVNPGAAHTLGIPGQSGLIPFAQGLSPSPRKIPISSNSHANPAKLQQTEQGDERDENLRLGSVRGKRADLRPSLNCFGLDEEEEEVGQAARAFAGEDSQQHLEKRSPEHPQEKEIDQQGSVRRITARPDGQKHHPESSSGPQRDRPQSSRGDTAQPGTDSHSSPLSPGGCPLPSRAQSPDWLDGRGKQADMEQPKGPPNGIRSSSESMSTQTSSSETIGKGMPGSPGSFTESSPHGSYFHSEYEHREHELGEDEPLAGRLRLPRPAEAEEEDMPTPVKQIRVSPLRHSSSVDDMAGPQLDQLHGRPRPDLASGATHLTRALAHTSLRRGHGHGRLATHHLYSSSYDLSLPSSAMPRPSECSPISQPFSSSTSPSAPASPAHGQGRSSGTGNRHSRGKSLALHSPRDQLQPLTTSSQLLHQPTEGWDEPGGRRPSIFPSATTTTTNFATHQRPRSLVMNASPPQSHQALSRRPRPGLPQHFIQQPRTDGTYRSPGFSTASRTPERSPRKSPQRSQTVYPSPPAARYNRRSVLGSDSLRPGAESAMSFHEPSLARLARSSGAVSSLRSKHSSLTTTDDFGNIRSSQSVSGGVYDLRNLTTGRIGRTRRATGSDEDERESTNTSQRHSKTGSGSDKRWAHQITDARSHTINTVQRERERTLRGSGGTRASHLVRASQDSTSRNGRMADQQSSSSGGSSSRHHYISSKPSRPTSRLLPISHRPDSNGLRKTLSPTPEVDHHKLLLGALEALEASDDEDELVNLVSGVVKQTCRINAALQSLVETGIGLQVELELAEEPERMGLLEFHRAESERAHAALVRVSNDQVRDLTETLICLQTRLRTRQRRAELSTRDSVFDQFRGELGGTSYARGTAVDLGAAAAARSLSRASGRYSRSASPAKAPRSLGGISPLTRISGLEDEDSPLDRVSKRIGVTERRTETGAALAIASTMAQSVVRHSSIGGAFQQRLRSVNRLSGSSQTMARQRKGEKVMDEFGSYRASLEEPLPRTSMSSDRIRSSRSMMALPNAPPKQLTTSLVTELNAHSHLGRISLEEEVDQVRGRGSMSSMSQMLDRAQSLLARRNTKTGQVQSRSKSIDNLRNVLGAEKGYQSSTNLDRFDDEEEDEEVEEENRTPMKHVTRRPDEEAGGRTRRTSTLSGASAALERLSGFGGGVRSWASGSIGVRTASGSGSGTLSNQAGQDRYQSAEEFAPNGIASGSGTGTRRKAGGSIQQLLKMKRASIIRN